MKLTVEQLRDLHAWLGKPLMHEMAKFIEAHSPAGTDGMGEMLEVCVPGKTIEPAFEWHPVPTIDTTRITRLRVLADELREAILAVRKESIADRDELLDLSQVIRTDIGRVIAIAALSSPFGSLGESK